MKVRPLIHGGALILVLFAMLAILGIAALTMMSAYLDLKLARAAAIRTIGYYELEESASEELKRANAMLREAYNGSYTYDFLLSLEESGWYIMESETGCRLLRSISITDGEQNLHIELLASEPDTNGRYYRILAWQQWQDSFEYETEGTDIWLG